MSVAEDMVDGLACSGCGIYFREEHGYPVLCGSCGKAALDAGEVNEVTTTTRNVKTGKEIGKPDKHRITAAGLQPSHLKQL